MGSGGSTRILSGRRETRPCITEELGNWLRFIRRNVLNAIRFRLGRVCGLGTASGSARQEQPGPALLPILLPIRGPEGLLVNLKESGSRASGAESSAEECVFVGDRFIDGRR